MSEQIHRFQIQLLLYFLESDLRKRTVTDASRTFGKTKASVSRALSELEKRGLVRRTASRKTVLTEQGSRLAEHYRKILRAAERYMQYQNLTMAQIKENAIKVVTAGFTPEYLALLRERERHFQIREAFSGGGRFSGSEFCKKLKDGSYFLPLSLHLTAGEGNGISFPNEWGFDHPGELVVRNHCGTVYLEKKDFHFETVRGGGMVRFQVGSLSCRNGSGEYRAVDEEGRYFSFPAEYLTFLGTGSGEQRILFANIRIRLELNGTDQSRFEVPAYLSLFVL